MYIDVKEELEKIQKKINKIEDEDSDFHKNEKWIELRQKQDMFYDYLRQEMEEDERTI